MKRNIVTIVSLIGFGLGVVTTRALWEGRNALHEADELAAAGSLTEAVTYYRRAARWYVPLASHVSDAYEQLESIGSDAQTAGDTELALAAWRGVRSSIMATRSFYTPHVERLEPANRRIAALMGAQQEVAKRNTLQVPDGHTSFEAFHYALLSKDRAPSVLWSIIALAGFGLWLGGGVLFALRGVSDNDELEIRPAAFAGVFILVGLIMWMTGLYFA